jgi:hypothetical protein
MQMCALELRRFPPQFSSKNPRGMPRGFEMQTAGAGLSRDFDQHRGIKPLLHAIKPKQASGHQTHGE